MKTYNTVELIDKLQQNTESLLIKAIHDWQMVSGERFSKQPSAESWSAKQCIAHLNIYGDYYLPAISNAIGKYRAHDNGMKETFTPGVLGNYFTKIMSPDKDGMPLKKMKAFKNYIASNKEESDEVISTFIDQQEKLLSLLEAAKDINLNKIKIPISLNRFIKLKLGDVFMFLVAHNQRHALQAERALQAAPVSMVKDL